MGPTKLHRTLPDITKLSSHPLGCQWGSLIRPVLIVRGKPTPVVLGGFSNCRLSRLGECHPRIYRATSWPDERGEGSVRSSLRQSCCPRHQLRVRRLAQPISDRRNHPVPK